MTVEWERPGVCKSDSIHRNLGKFSQASSLSRAESNANFCMLLPVKLQTVETVSCVVKQLSAVIADLSSRALGSGRSNTHLCHSWILSQVLELSWAFPKESVLPSGSEWRQKWTFLQSVPFKLQVKSSESSVSDLTDPCQGLQKQSGLCAET